MYSAHLSTHKHAQELKKHTHTHSRTYKVQQVKVLSAKNGAFTCSIEREKSFSFCYGEYAGKIAIETSYAARGTQCMQCNTKNSFAKYTHLWDIIF